jgi:putative hydrolase of the HAD superfamily
MIRTFSALLIDLDGVIRTWPTDVDTAIETKYGLPLGSIKKAAFASELLHPAIIGEVTDEEWRENVANRLAEACGPEKARDLVDDWSLSTGVIDPAILSILRSFHGRLRKVLVTNGTSRLSRDLRRLGIYDCFDDVVNSSEIGSFKPDAAMFQEALERAGVPASEALFVDDTKGHAAAAEALGISSHWYQGIDGLKRFLTASGIPQNLLEDPLR